MNKYLYIYLSLNITLKKKIIKKKKHEFNYFIKAVGKTQLIIYLFCIEINI